MEKRKRRMETEISRLLKSPHGNTFNYATWIERERRVRLKILRSSLVIQQKQEYCVCSTCGEVCLCHEDKCPNCNQEHIMVCKIKNLDKIEKENSL